MAKSSVLHLETLLDQQAPPFKRLLEETLQELLEGQMTEFVGAAAGERNKTRSGYRAGHCNRSLATRFGTLELRVPRDRARRFSTELLERYPRSEKALISALGQMFVLGCTPANVKSVAEELCGQALSGSTLHQIEKGLAAALARYERSVLEEAYPRLILQARHERVRVDSVLRSRVVLMALGIDREGRCRMLGVELANGVSRASWNGLLRRLKQRGLHGVESIVGDDGDAAMTKAVRLTGVARRLAALPVALPARRDAGPAARRRRRLPAGAAQAMRPTLARAQRRTSTALDVVAPTVAVQAALGLSERESVAAGETVDHPPNALDAPLAQPGIVLAPGLGAVGRDARDATGERPIQQHGSDGRSEPDRPEERPPMCPASGSLGETQDLADATTRKALSQPAVPRTDWTPRSKSRMDSQRYVAIHENHSRTSKVLVGLAGALAVAGFLFWGVGLMADAPEELVSAAKDFDVAPRDVDRVQGLDQPAPITPRPVTTPPMRSRFQLSGVAVAKRADGGVALIGIDGRSARVFRVGATVDGELVLQAVSSDGATLGPAGGPATVILEVATAAATSHAVLRAGAGQTLSALAGGLPPMPDDADPTQSAPDMADSLPPMTGDASAVQPTTAAADGMVPTPAADLVQDAAPARPASSGAQSRSRRLRAYRSNSAP